MRAHKRAAWVFGAAGVLGAGFLYACVTDEATPVVINNSDGGEGGGETTPDASAADGAGSGDATAACKTSKDCPSSAPTCAGGTCKGCAQGSTDCAMNHPSTPQCGSTGACVECIPTADGGSPSAFCAMDASTPFCGPLDNCVECVVTNDCIPHVCGTDNSCRACKTNAECPAGACGDDGNCVAGIKIAYVDNGGMTIAGCKGSRQPIDGNTLKSAWCDITDAVGQKPYIVVIGHGATFPYSPFGVNSATPVTIIGPGIGAPLAAVVGGSIAVGGFPNDGVITVTTPPTTSPGVTIDGLEITSTSSPAEGIQSNGNALRQFFRVRNTYIHDIHGEGIANQDCDLVIEDNKFSGTDLRAIIDNNTVFAKYVIQRNDFSNGEADGIYVGSGPGLGPGVDLTFDRNTVSNYVGGNALQIFGPALYRITNSFFYLNRTAVDFSTSGTVAGRTFQFNTIALNQGSGLGSCDSDVTYESSILVNNGDAPTFLSGCKQAHLVLDNDAGAPAFVNTSDPSKYDFHLAIAKPADLKTNTTCCIDQVLPTYDAGRPLSDHDYDGTKRPLGAGYDIGAHEAK
jgi:hypothetical protein